MTGSKDPKLLENFDPKTELCAGKIFSLRLQVKSTKNVKIDVCTCFHHHATQHIFLTTHLIHLHAELYEFTANQNLGMPNS